MNKSTPSGSHASGSGGTGSRGYAKEAAAIPRVSAGGGTGRTERNDEDEFVNVYSRGISTSSSNWSNLSVATGRKKPKPRNLQLKSFERSDSDLGIGHRERDEVLPPKARTDAAPTGSSSHGPRPAAVQTMSPKLREISSVPPASFEAELQLNRKGNSVVGARSVQPESYVPLDLEGEELQVSQSNECNPNNIDGNNVRVREREQSELFAVSVSSRLVRQQKEDDREKNSACGTQSSASVKVADISAESSIRALPRKVTSSSGNMCSRSQSRAYMEFQERSMERKKDRKHAAVFLRRNQKSYSQDDAMEAFVSVGVGMTTLEHKLDNLDVWGEEDEDVADLDQNFGAPRVTLPGGRLPRQITHGNISGLRASGLNMAGSGDKGVDFARQYLTELAAHEAIKQKYERTTANLESTVARIHELNEEYKTSEQEFMQKISAVEDELYEAVNENLSLMSAHAVELEARVMQQAQLCSEIVTHKDAREESAARLRNVMEIVLASPELAEKPELLQNLLEVVLPARPDDDCEDRHHSKQSTESKEADGGKKRKGGKDKAPAIEQVALAMNTPRERLLESDLERSTCTFPCLQLYFNTKYKYPATERTAPSVALVQAAVPPLHRSVRVCSPKRLDGAGEKGCPAPAVRRSSIRLNNKSFRGHPEKGKGRRNVRPAACFLG